MNSIFSLGLSVLLCGALSIPAMAQTGPMPATDVVKDDFVTQLAGSRIRILYENFGQPFLIELQDRDVGQLFSYGLPPADRGISTTDMIIGIFEGWAEASDFFHGRNLSRIADEFPEAGAENAGAYVNVSGLTANDGRHVRFYTFMRTVNGVPQDERCMARLIIDDTYVGTQNGGYDSTTCSDQIQ